MILMNIQFNTKDKAFDQTLIVGVAGHLNQLSQPIVVDGVDITEELSQLKHDHIVGSQVGKIYQTQLQINDKKYRLVTIGLANLKQLTSSDIAEVFGNLFQFLKAENVTTASLLFDSFEAKELPVERIAELLGQQSMRSIYEFDNYKTTKKAPYELIINLHSENQSIITSVQQGQAIGQAINLARDYSNMPPNILTPSYYEEVLTEHFKDTEVQLDVKNEEQLQNEGFGLVHAVSKGSSNPARVFTLTYNGASNDKAPIALVGKGITYDSGGYSIKSKLGMQTMKYDMCGSANVIGMIEAARLLKLKINIVGVIVASENMINGEAMKPDDVFTALSGETVEVLNTDAEGRLVLGDAVFYANQFKPQVILDFATLTGAAVAALGEDKAAVFKNNDKAPLATILEHANETDEMVFELPMTATEQRLIRQTDVADLVNHTNGHGKALFAATFISHFAGDTPHLHFDIAGPATTHKASFNGPKGPTGYMIPTIVQWLRSL
jgi:leucyl aminopeptidase